MSLSEKNQAAKSKKIFEKTLKHYIYTPPFSYAFKTEDSRFVLKSAEKIDIPDSVWILMYELRKRDMSQKRYDFPSNYVNQIVASALAMWLARESNMISDEKIPRIGGGVAVHDIGKLLIKKKVLYKQREEGELTKQEREEIEKHPLYTKKLLVKKGVKDLIYLSCGEEHQMYFIDAPAGAKYGGYPAKKDKENQPSIYGQITAVADCTESLVLGRPYRNNLESRIGSIDRAIAELERGSDINLKDKFGVQFNPYLAKLMINFLKRVPR